MISRRRLLLLMLLIALIVAGLAATIRRRAFGDRIDRETAELLAAARPPAVRLVSESDLAGLPAPVQRWLRAAGVVGSPVPSIVQLRQEGDFRLGAEKPWMPYHATQYYTIDPPGFLWDVSMRMYSLVEITGRDRYTEGTGDIAMRIASIVPVASAAGGNLNSGALLRYLNEMMWFPAALVLPNIAWEPLDDTSARATLTDAGRSVSAVFHFDEQNQLVNMTAERWNESEQAMRPWSTPLTEWGEFAGIAMPVAGAGRWGDDTNAYDYIRLRVTDVTYTVE